MIFPHKGRDIEEDVNAFRRLYEEGAMLIPCSKEKKPAVEKVKDEYTKEFIKPSWQRIESHVRNGGWIGYYAPGLQGLLVLDFDPIVEEWLEDVSDYLGSPPMDYWNSSGKIKPAKDGKPEGFGAHAVWKARPDAGTSTRHFSYTTDGIPVGEIFSIDTGFYFIAYNPTALVDVMDADDCECVDPSDLPPAGRTGGGGANYSEDWKPDPNSRHDSCVSAVASAAKQFDKRERFAAELEKIRQMHANALKPEEQQRDVKGEWIRIEKKGWEYWERDRERENEERRAEQGKADKNDPKEIQEALLKARSPRTRRHILHISKKNGDKAKPEIPMIKGIKEIADDLEIPDANANHEVEALLKAGEAMGVPLDQIIKTRMEYQNEWRNKRKVVMHLGDFPLVSKFAFGLQNTKAEAETMIRSAGGVAMRHGFQCKTSDDLMAVLRATGVNIVWSELDTAITLQHDKVKEWRNVTPCAPPDFKPVMQLQKGILRSVMTTKKVEDASIKDENGKPTVRWRATPVMQQEMNGKAFIAKMLGQVGSDIPRVDYTVELTKWVMHTRDKMSEQERQECINLASRWILEIPYINVVDREKNEPLAIAASKIVYAVFFHRRFQFMSGITKPYSQRTVPSFGGPKRVGKTTIVNNLFPKTGVFSGRIESGFSWSNDDNDMKRKVSGKLLAINDELMGIKSTKPDTVKNFITWSDGDYHEKYKNYEKMVRSDVLVATANQSNEIPADEALRDRFLFVNLDIAEEYSDQERYKGIVQWFSERWDKLLVGGLIMAEDDYDLNPPVLVEELRSDSIIALDASNNHYLDAINKIVRNGLYSKMGSDGPIISLCLIALHSGLLKYQRDVWVSGTEQYDTRIHSRGDIIRPEDAKGDHEFEWSPEVQEAFKVRGNERSQTGAITQIKGVVHTMHGSHALKKRFNCPNIEGVRGGKFRGFEVLDGRLKKEWSMWKNDSPASDY